MIQSSSRPASCRIGLFVFCLLCLLSAGSRSLYGIQELPGENQLPSRGGKATVLPDESTLPATTTSGVAAGLMSLPAESELPPVFKAANPNPDKAVDGSGNLADEIDVLPDDEFLSNNDRPILRLNLNGPTAPVKAIQFSADSKRILAGGDDKSLHV